MKKIVYSLLFIAMTFGASVKAQENVTYQLPPQEILQLADADMPPSISTDRKAENAFLSYRSRLRFRIHHERPDTRTEITMAMANPYSFLSMPLIRFIPKRLAIRVGNIMMILTDVRVRIVVFMLLLMILE